MLNQLLRQQALHTCSTRKQQKKKMHSQLFKVEDSRNLIGNSTPPPPQESAKYVVGIQDVLYNHTKQSSRNLLK